MSLRAKTGTAARGNPRVPPTDIWSAFLCDSNPQPVNSATPTPGVATEASRCDHVHAHGDLAGGDLHAAVVAGGASGFMTGADKSKLDGITPGATNTPLSDTVATAIGVASAGVAGSASRSDHVHPFAAQAANSVLANATGGAAVPTAVTVAANKFLARAAAGNLSEKDITDFILTLMDDPDAATARSTLGAAPVTGFPSAKIITETTANRALSAADAGAYIRCTNAGGCAVTVPTATFSQGDVVYLHGVLGLVTVAGSGGFVITPPTSKDRSTAEAGATMALVFDTAGTADLMGELADV